MTHLHRASTAAAAALGVALAGCAGPSVSAGVERAFVATTTAGDEVSGQSLRGRVTIIDFWGVF